MAGKVLAAAVPAAVGLRLGLQAGADAKESQHAVGLELEEVPGVQLLGVLQRPAGQAHRRQRQRPRRVGDTVLYLELAGLAMKQAAQGKKVQGQDENPGFPSVP